MSISDLEAHFLHFLSPSNMFAVPKKWAGFSEIDAVLKMFKEPSAVLAKSISNHAANFEA